jgi:hypothetical protein
VCLELLGGDPPGKYLTLHVCPGTEPADTTLERSSWYLAQCRANFRLTHSKLPNTVRTLSGLEPGSGIVEEGRVDGLQRSAASADCGFR